MTMMKLMIFKIFLSQQIKISASCLRLKLSLNRMRSLKIRNRSFLAGLQKKGTKKLF